ncbi:MAG TPA: hypothetical protein DCL41_09710 [Bdellovibrionales bacterium]|nr:hypothetical protein [Pseudobdellovibrionaceae bacterium]HAG92138.1 hypothetical protein [Bdellovibrionales bacterium]|tara:strand:- start:1960 stop:2700 length:741 start_codon:yes stop_codon:yes gene_type:complete
MLRFKDKAVFITGGSSGIGLATAARFLNEGAKVFICSRNSQKINSALNSLKSLGPVSGFAADLSQADQVETAVQAMIKEFGQMDILVNSAGLTQAGKISDISLSDFHKILDANLTNTFLMCQAALPELRKTKGQIVNVASVAGRFRSAFSGVHYTSSKAAVIALTRQLAFEFGGDGIRVNVICPGPTETEMLSPFLKEFGKDHVKNQNPLKVLMQPEDAAGPILFLCSEDARCITGASLDVNCGIF